MVTPRAILPGENVKFPARNWQARLLSVALPANYFGRAGALRKLTRSPRSVALRVGQGIPNS